MLPIFLTLLSFVKFTGPTDVENNVWQRLSQDLKTRLAPLHQEIARIATNNTEQIEILGDTLTTQIRQFFEEHSAFFLDEVTKVPGKTYISHNNSTITQLEDLKKSMRAEAFGPEGSEDKRKQFYIPNNVLTDRQCLHTRLNHKTFTLHICKQK